MKSHQILVQSLEEFPHNNEFVGRNFNAGEVIQLVLKNRRGEWLPEKWVQMVMVHELAHCKEMNHGPRFWKWRNDFAGDLRGLWAKSYTGEGMWGRGRSLQDGEIMTGDVDDGMVPENLCGGTYGRKRRKRKRDGKGKETLSYAERKQRRILKKFGAGGLALGADDETKAKLEGGVVKKGKPRVAGSARGRELRAAAALARFDQVKKDEVPVKAEESDSNTEDEYDEPDDAEAAVDIDGKRLRDENGYGLVKICEGEDYTDVNAKNEMVEFRDLSGRSSQKAKGKASVFTAAPMSREPDAVSSAKPAITIEKRSGSDVYSSDSRQNGASSAKVTHLDEIYKRRPGDDSGDRMDKLAVTSFDCAVCSLVNESGSVTCSACSNVLNPHLTTDYWRCKADCCKDSTYFNPGDAGLCGICGKSRLSQS